MSQYNIDINIDVESASLGQLEAELGRLNDEIKEIPRGTREFNKAASNIKKVGGEVEKVGKQLQKADIGQIAGDFAKVGAAIGAAGILFTQFGEEGSASNEAIQKTLERTQAILGLVALAEGVVSAARLASAAATKIQTAAQNAANAATATGVVTLNTLKTALIATGIGAFVVALGSLVAYWDEFKDAISGGELAQARYDFEAFGSRIQKVAADLEIQEKKYEDLISRGVDVEDNINDLITTQLDYNVQLARLIDQRVAILEIERDATAENTKEREEAEANLINVQKEGELLLIEGAKKQNENLKRLNEERLSNTKFNIEQEKALGLDTFESEKRLLQLRIDFYKRFGNNFLAEIKDLEREITLLELAEQRKRNEQYKANLQKRRDLLRSELGEIVTIIETDPVFALSKLSDESERAFGILEKYSGGSRDLTKVIKDLEKEGLTPLANQFRLLGDSANFEQFQALIEKYYGTQLKQTIKGAIDAVSNLESEFESIPVFFERLSGAVTSDQLQILVQTQFNTIKAELESFRETAEDEVIRLLNAGAITTEVADELLKGIEDDFYNKLAALNKQYLTATKTAIEESYKELQLASTKLINQTNRDLKKLEQPYVGFKGFLKAFRDDRFKEEIALRKKLVNNEETAIKDQIAKVKELRDAGVISEVDAKLQIEALDEELFKNQLARQQILTDERIKGWQDTVFLINTAAETLEAYGQFLQATADLQIAELDIEIARREKQLEQQLEGITNEEKRAQATTKADKEIQALKDKQTKIAAENQKKQANIDFALTSGQIVAQTALAIMRALAQLGPIAGGVATGLISATGLLQLAAANRARQAAIAQADASLAGIGEFTGSSGGGRTQFADGGYVSGPGTGRSDSIPARLSNGEYVINAKSTAAFLPMLEQINNAGRRFAEGGMVSNGPDLTDILMRIERRLATPPKAYVVSSEIQKGLDSDEYLQRRAQLT
jgi:hypothetical protein